MRVSTQIVAVTTLTSLNQDDFSDLGVNRTVEEQAVALGELAIGSGIDGLVTSAHEAHAGRNFSRGMKVIDAGDTNALGMWVIRSGWRSTSLRSSIATHLVIGRPIVHAADPVLATSRTR